MEMVENLDDVLKDYLGATKTITNYEISRLTSPGENFGSVMLKIEGKILDFTSNKVESFEAVAKLLPKEEILRKAFNIFVTFKNEVCFYTTVIPTLQHFQNEEGINDVINCFPKLFGSRINMDKEVETVDDSAVLILENLIVSGYKNVDRRVGFDLSTTKFLLRDLANFHALPIGLKLKRRDLFEQKIKPYLAYFDPPEQPPQFKQNLIQIFEEREDFRSFVPQLNELLNKKATHSSREPFATIVHNDFWVNNTMVKFDKSGSVMDNKMVDFQLCGYESPAKDLIFFLFSSVQIEILQKYLDQLIQFYYDEFIKTLKGINCDTSAFTFELFMQEINFEATQQLVHILGMFFVIFGEKGVFKEEGPPVFPTANQMQKEKSWFVVKEFVRRGWL